MQTASVNPPSNQSPFNPPPSTPAAPSNTKFKTNNTDLIGLFRPRTSSSYLTTTGYFLSEYQKDLSEIFEPYIAGHPKVPPTNYISNGSDLSDIFLNIN